MKKKQRKSKSKTTKPKVVRKAAPRKRAPAARPQEAQQAAQPQAPKQAFPVTVHVLKGDDRIPVTVTDQAHLDRLTATHGAGSVQVSQ